MLNHNIISFIFQNSTFICKIIDCSLKKNINSNQVSILKVITKYHHVNYYAIDFKLRVSFFFLNIIKAVHLSTVNTLYRKLRVYHSFFFFWIPKLRNQFPFKDIMNEPILALANKFCMSLNFDNAKISLSLKICEINIQC